MKLPINKLHFFSVSASILFLVMNCSEKKSENKAILGEWNAEWETNGKDLPKTADERNLHMDGKIHFYDDGTVEISAFGYHGCIFSSDTLRNKLHWKLHDNTLRFVDNGDGQGLPYNISKLTDNEMKLTLMNDIYLTLKR